MDYVLAHCCPAVKLKFEIFPTGEKDSTIPEMPRDMLWARRRQLLSGSDCAMILSPSGRLDNEPSNIMLSTSSSDRHAKAAATATSTPIRTSATSTVRKFLYITQQNRNETNNLSGKAHPWHSVAHIRHREEGNCKVPSKTPAINSPN
jgi:hypothetical protein